MKSVLLSKLLFPDSQFRVMHRSDNRLDYRRNNLFCGNVYRFFQDYVEGECFDGQKFKVDIDDYELIRPYVWHIDKNNYVITKYKGKVIKQHRLILDIVDNPELEVDHIDFDTHDNRKSKIRLATRSQNCIHQRITDKNTSGVVGVYYMKSMNKWAAQITCNNIKYYLGCYNTIEEAQNARIVKEKELHGEFGINISTTSSKAANSGMFND